jgi:hypothetical protein
MAANPAISELVSSLARNTPAFYPQITRSRQTRAQRTWIRNLLAKIRRAIPQDAYSVLIADRQHLLEIAWNEIEHELGSTYDQLGPPPNFSGRDANG